MLESSQRQTRRESMPPRLAVLASGTGSLFEAMLEQGVSIDYFLADRECRALGISIKEGVPSMLLPRPFNKHFDRDKYTRALIRFLHEHDIGLVAMAGFMTVLSPSMFAPGAYRSKVLNTHPSLLPSFKGHWAVKDALEYGVKVTGCTIHLATEELDNGPILAQEAVRVMPGDTVESLHERIKAVERVLYPVLIKELIS